MSLLSSGVFGNNPQYLFWTGSNASGTFANTEGYDTGCNNFTDGTTSYYSRNGDGSETDAFRDRPRLPARTSYAALRLPVTRTRSRRLRPPLRTTLDEGAHCVKYGNTMWLYEFV